MKTVQGYLDRSPFLMAPMAGITDSAYRLMAKKGGAKLCYTEMVSVSGIHFASRGTLELLRCFGGMNPRLRQAVINKVPNTPFMTEGPLAVQLFGSDPQLFSQAVPVLEREVGERLALIDINMACPVKKVRKIGAGAELLRNSVRAQKIVDALKKATKLPVTAKIRLLEDDDIAVSQTREFAKRLEQAGVDAITLHGRSASEFYRGTSNLDAVAKVGRVLSIPLIASGDMFSAQAGVTALKTPGISGVMFARGTLGNPWIFNDADLLLESSNQDGAYRGKHFGHAPEEKLNAFIEHVGLLVLTEGRILRARTLFCHYIKNFPQARIWRDRIMKAVEPADFIAVANAYKEELSDD